jgi:hypothetical protein
VVHGGPSAPSSPELCLRPLRGSRSPAKGSGRWRRGRGTGWRPHLAPAGDEEAARRRGVVAVVGARRRRAWTAEERIWGEGWLPWSIARPRVPFIGPLMGGEAVRCGEGNGRRWSAPLMAFTPSVSGGERRGRRPVQKGKRMRSSGTRFRAEEVPGGHGGTPAFGREVAVAAATRGRRRQRRLLILYVF